MLALCMFALATSRRLNSRGRTTNVSLSGGGDIGWLQESGGLGSRAKAMGLHTKCSNSASFWWFDEARPQAFSFFSLDDLYGAPYFKSDHISSKVVDTIVMAQRNAYRLLSGRELRSVAEFGGAGGWFTAQFAALGLDYQVPAPPLLPARRHSPRAE